MKPLLVLAAFPVVLMGWASCSHSGTGHAALPDPRAVDKSVPEYKNPFHPSTYAHFVARKDYRKTYDVYKDDTLLNRQPLLIYSYVLMRSLRFPYTLVYAANRAALITKV